MKNLRNFFGDPEDLFQNDWEVVPPDHADFAFRCWGGSSEYPHLIPTKNIEHAKDMSESSWIYIKSKAPWVFEVFDGFDIPRMFKDRVGGSNNPGGNIFNIKQITTEYLTRRDELEIEGNKGLFET